MKIYLALVMLAGAVLLAVPSTSRAQGAVDGNIVYFDGLPADVTVQLFDAGNAEIVGETTTSASGSFGFKPVRAGSYKVRFSPGRAPGKSTAEFFDKDGRMHLDEFLLGSEIVVVDGEAVLLNKCELGKPQITEIQYFPPSAFNGYVFDALTGLPLPDVEVRLIDGTNALPLYTAVTAADGYFEMWHPEKHQSMSGKVRIVDPSGAYKPEFVGAGDVDVFEKGTAYDLRNGDKFALRESLDMLTPEESIATIVEDVVWLGLDGAVESALTGTLTRATGFLTDENPNNNRAACGALTGFVRQMNGHVKSGKISLEEADALAAAASETMLSLQCP